MNHARFSQLVEMAQIQRLLDADFKAEGMPISINEAADNTILAHAGWQEICTRFHQVHPQASKRCQESDAAILKRLVRGESHASRCRNGLWDIGIPILVGDHHLASIYLGQFFYNDEAPDRDYFVKQAEEFGFDLPAYLAALDRVPRFSRERVAGIVDYYIAFAALIGDLAAKNYHLDRELKDRKRIEKNLRESESKLALTLNSIGDGLIATDAQGRITMMNPVAEHLTGWTQGQAAGRSIEEIFKIINENSREDVENPVAHVLRDGQIVGLANHTLLISRDGVERPIADSGSPIRVTEDGEIHGVVLVFRDQTAERRAQLDLERSERRLHNLINAAPFGAFEYEVQDDDRLILIAANQAADEILGVECALFINRPMEESFPALATTSLPAIFRKVALEGEACEQDHVEYHEGQINGAFEIKAIQTHRNRMAVFFRDVTERKKAEAAMIDRMAALTSPLGDLSDLRFEDLFDLEEVQQIQDAFAEATGVASIITDTGGRPITRPSRFCHLCQGIIRQTEQGLANCIHSDAVLGRKNPHGPIMQPCLSGGLWDGGTSICVGDRHIANWLIGQVLDETRDPEDMLRYAREIGADEGEFLEALGQVNRMTQAQFNKVCQALFIIAKQLSRLAAQNVQQSREIARRKLAEQERRKLEMQILHAQKLESLGVLAGGIAHDFNNLLMAILGHADLAQQDLSPVSPVRENIREIERASRRAASLCQQMLAYSGKGKFVIQVADLGEVVAEMAHMLEVSISKKAVLRYNFAPQLPPVEADLTQLRQIIMNLIVNASEAIGDKSGIIAISTGAMECDRSYLSEAWLDENLPTGLYVYLEVADTGSGMDRETLSKIFDPFFTTKFTGRGLGLAAVLGIVRGHRGAVKVYSEVGRGTTFKILFPGSRRPIPKAKGEVGLPQHWRGSGTVLLVDDEETIRALGKQMLERFGFKVMTAADGREALKLFSACQKEIILVMLDLTMPHMDGEETFRELRRLSGEVRVILSSGYNEQEVSQRFIGKGLAGFIQKPYQMSMLEGVIKKALAVK